ncbi:glycine zipper family protein [Caballeronia sp. LZ019]|uniref:glycine zipper family protein n=1 Tax=Caballeronia sp. LZ019 TaxID=3038555 RepID=UPI002867282B|nr:glycine zipper family protein [Caballeronia sp. LZ019]MDR5808463.1 glycine zipper family protein [Caballeronia sp. LZ019]
MSSLSFDAATNTIVDSHHDVDGHDMPAVVHFFFVVEEIGRDGILVRKVYASPTDPYLLAKNLPEFQLKHDVWPEKFGIRPADPNSSASVAQHVYSSRQYPSDYVSASSTFPNGSPRFTGKTIFIDIEKAKAAGAKIVSTDEIVAALQKYKETIPHRAKKVDQIIEWVRDIDKEVLLKGSVPAKAVFTPTSYAVTRNIVRVLKVSRIFAIGFTAYDLEQAADESIRQDSIKPIRTEIVRQSGGWGSAMAGRGLGRR